MPKIWQSVPLSASRTKFPSPPFSSPLSLMISSEFAALRAWQEAAHGMGGPSSAAQKQPMGWAVRAAATRRGALHRAAHRGESTPSAQPRRSAGERCLAGRALRHTICSVLRARFVLEKQVGRSSVYAFLFSHVRNNLAMLVSAHMVVRKTANGRRQFEWDPHCEEGFDGAPLSSSATPLRQLLVIK